MEGGFGEEDEGVETPDGIKKRKVRCFLLHYLAFDSYLNELVLQIPVDIEREPVVEEFRCSAPTMFSSLRRDK